MSRWPAMAGAVLLSGCALIGAPREQNRLAWEARQAQLAPVTGFTVQARVAAGLGARGDLHWKQRPDAFEARVSGPFGADPMEIRGNGARVEVRTARETLVTDDPEGLLRERVGWSLPLERMRWWALGLPAPGAASETVVDHLGRLVLLEQAGWRVEYGEYQRAEPLELPRRIELAHGDLTVKVVVDAWRSVQCGEAACAPHGTE